MFIELELELEAKRVLIHPNAIFYIREYNTDCMIKVADGTILIVKKPYSEMKEILNGKETLSSTGA